MVPFELFAFRVAPIFLRRCPTLGKRLELLAQLILRIDDGT